MVAKIIRGFFSSLDKHSKNDVTYVLRNMRVLRIVIREFVTSIWYLLWNTLLLKRGGFPAVRFRSKAADNPAIPNHGSTAL